MNTFGDTTITLTDDTNAYMVDVRGKALSAGVYVTTWGSGDDALTRIDLTADEAIALAAALTAAAHRSVELVQAHEAERSAAQAERDARAAVSDTHILSEIAKAMESEQACRQHEAKVAAAPIRSMASIPVQTPAQAEALRENFAEANARANVAAARKARRSAKDQVRFVQVNHGVYSVFCDTVLVGTVQKHTNEFGHWWTGYYNDGSEAYSHDTRIDTAWALINS